MFFTAAVDQPGVGGESGWGHLEALRFLAAFGLCRNYRRVVYVIPNAGICHSERSEESQASAEAMPLHPEHTVYWMSF